MKNIFIIFMSFAMVLCINDFSFAKNDKEKSLPPGLHKKVERGRGLPPGWERKLVVGKVLDSDIYEQGTIIDDDKGLVTIRVEDKLIRIIKNTREIMEILDGM